MHSTAMFPRLLDAPEKRAVEMPDGCLSYAELDGAAARVAARLPAGGPLALWATPSLATVVGLLAGLRAGTPLIPLNPKSGELELAHVIGDAKPSAVLAAADVRLPRALAATARIDVGARADDDAVAAGDRSAGRGAPPPDTHPALIMYTSGTTGPPKGVVQTYGSLVANLDALSEVWGLTSADRLVHALPLFHVHGLVLATIGPLRFGGTVRHVGSFAVASVAQALQEGATVMYAVPTMYRRLLAAAEHDRRIADALRRARLLVSGSAALAVDVHAGIERLSGHAVVERYGMTETLIISSTRPGERGRPGYVGRALPGVQVRVRDDDGAEVPCDDTAIGSVWVCGPSVFERYVDREPPAAESSRDGWFQTGDLAAVAADGALRLVGRSSSDLIKSGGYRIAAGEIESALRAHPAVSEAAVRGMPDAELGERVVAWVVPAAGASAAAVADGELIDHVARQLTPHKRPREIHRVACLPRNELGKVQKQLLDRPS